jgi:hypothetical protein
MSDLVLTNARIEIDGNVVSTDGNTVNISYEAETDDNTTFGDSTRSNIGGLKNWSMELNFVQDFANTEIDSILFPLVGTDFEVKIRPDAGVISTSNPEYVGRGLLQSYAPLGGSVGELAQACQFA